MKGDFSRNSFAPNKQYSSVRMQQGRVQMDADWNEQMDITDYYNRLFTEDFLGATIGPAIGAGFAINTTPDQQNVTIGLGRYYVNGLLIDNQNALQFTQQPSYPNAALPISDGTYLFYLQVWQQNIDMTYDVDIAESALGGADTATRIRNIAQVKWLPVDATGVTNLTYNSLFNINAATNSVPYKNAQTWAAITNRLPIDSNDMTQLTPCVNPTAMTATNNHIYRIQIKKSGDSNQATFIWGSDIINITQITPVSSTVNNITLALQPTPPFAVGQSLLLSNSTRNNAGTAGDPVQITAIDTNNPLKLTISGVINADIIVPNAPTAQRLAVANISQITTVSSTVHTITIPAQPSVPFSVKEWLKLFTTARPTGDLVQISAINATTLTVLGNIGADITPANAAKAQRANSPAILVANSIYSELEPGVSVNFSGDTFTGSNYWSLTTNAANKVLNWPKISSNYLPQLAQDYLQSDNAISQLTPSINDSINTHLQNQLYRIEIHQGGTAATATFKWSRDNAAVSTRISNVQLIKNNNNIVIGGQFTITITPQDSINGFNINQWLELTTPIREFKNTPGDIVQITKISGATLTVTGMIGTDIADHTQNPLARRWDTATNNPNSTAVNRVDLEDFIALENSLSVIFSGNNFQTGDYWLIPTRTSNQVLWPTDDITSAFLTQLPQGILNGYAPLAIMQRSSGMWNVESDARTLATPMDQLDVIGADPGAPSNTIHVDRYGQVGITTDTPNAKLDVETTAAMAGQDAIHAIANSNGIAIQAATNNNMAAEFKNNSTQPTLQLTNNGNGQALQTHGDTSINGSLIISNTNSGSFSATPALNKIPVANQSGYIDARWLGEQWISGTIADMPQPLCYFGTAQVNGRIYVVGGQTNNSVVSKAVMVYDPINNSWITIDSLNVARMGLSCSTVGGKIYAMGGCNSMGLGNVLNSVEVYDTANPNAGWQLSNPMKTKRCVFASSVVGTKIYAIGGVDSSERLNSMEVYDTANPNAGWQSSSAMKTPRAFLSSSVVGTKIYAVAGSNTDSNGITYRLRSVEIYNTANPDLGWQPSSNVLTTSRDNLTTSVIGTKIYAIGGVDETTLKSVEIYDTLNPNAGWRLSLSTSWLCTARHAFRSIFLNNNIYVFGGEVCLSNPLNMNFSIIFSSVEVLNLSISSSR